MVKYVKLLVLGNTYVFPKQRNFDLYKPLLPRAPHSTDPLLSKWLEFGNKSHLTNYSQVVEESRHQLKGEGGEVR